jgi:hypothetical protein
MIKEKKASHFLTHTECVHTGMPVHYVFMRTSRVETRMRDHLHAQRPIVIGTVTFVCAHGERERERRFRREVPDAFACCPPQQYVQDTSFLGTELYRQYFSNRSSRRLSLPSKNAKQALSVPPPGRWFSK